MFNYLYLLYVSKMYELYNSKVVEKDVVGKNILNDVVRMFIFLK